MTFNLCFFCFIILPPLVPQVVVVVVVVVVLLLLLQRVVLFLYLDCHQNSALRSSCLSSGGECCRVWPSKGYSFVLSSLDIGAISCQHGTGSSVIRLPNVPECLFARVCMQNHEANFFLVSVWWNFSRNVI